MASGFYLSYVQSCLDSTASDLTTATVKIDLLRTSAYTVNLTTHNFRDDVAAAVASATIGTKTINSPEGGVFDGADIVFPTVGAGAAINCAIIWVDTAGASSTDPLVCYIDGFSVTPTGVDISFVCDAGVNRIFRL